MRMVVLILSAPFRLSPWTIYYIIASSLQRCGARFLYGYGIPVTVVVSEVEHLLWFKDSLRGKALQNKRLFISLSTCWALWCARSAVIFKHLEFDVGEVVESVKLLS